MKLTQKELGEKVNINPSQITHIESGSRAIPLVHAKALLKVLKIERDTFITAVAIDAAKQVEEVL